MFHQKNNSIRFYSESPFSTCENQWPRSIQLSRSYEIPSLRFHSSLQWLSAHNPVTHAWLLTCQFMTCKFLVVNCDLWQKHAVICCMQFLTRSKLMHKNILGHAILRMQIYQLWDLLIRIKASFWVLAEDRWGPLSWAVGMLCTAPPPPNTPLIPPSTPSHPSPHPRMQSSLKLGRGYFPSN